MSYEDVLFGNYQYWWLSNFSAFQVDVFGQTWPTTEHAYQAQKFIGSGEAYLQISMATSPLEAKVLADANLDKLRPNWGSLKLSVMEEVLRAKLAQHVYVRLKLIKTGKRRLVENSSTDAFWGRGPDWRGENHLGRLWMKLRAEL